VGYGEIQLDIAGYSWIQVDTAGYSGIDWDIVGYIGPAAKSLDIDRNKEEIQGNTGGLSERYAPGEGYFHSSSASSAPVWLSSAAAVVVELWLSTTPSVLV